MVCLPIMHGESQTHEVREDSCGALLRLNWGVVWWWGNLAGEREAIFSVMVSICDLWSFRSFVYLGGFLVALGMQVGVEWTYGTIFGPVSWISIVLRHQLLQ